MLNVERNLDELFDYTQGLIKELQEKNKGAIKSEPNMQPASPAPSLSSFKQIREDVLQYKAWQKKQAGLLQDHTEDDPAAKISVLEQQWRNQKSENQLTPSSSFMMPLKQVRQSVLLEPHTPSKMKNNTQERCLTETQALPYDDFEDQEQANQQNNGGPVVRPYEKRSQSAQRQRSKENLHQTPSRNSLAQREESRRDEKKRGSADRSVSPGLKPTKSISDAGSWKSRTADSSKQMHKKTPNLDEVKRFLQKNFGESSKPSSMNDRVLLQKLGYDSRDLCREVPDIDSLAFQRRTQSEKTPAFEVNLNARPFQEELSEIEQREKFEMDFDISESTAKIFSKRSSIVVNELPSQGWGFDDILRDDVEVIMKGQRYVDNGINGDQMRSVPLSNMELNRRQTNPLINNRNHLVQPKVPVRSVNIDCKGAAEAGSVTKCPPKVHQSASKWKSTTSHQKENTEVKNNPNTSIYSQILGRSQIEIKSAIDFSQKKPAKNAGRSASINRAQSRGRLESRLEEMNRSVCKNKPAPTTNEGDRLYQEIIEKLNKEKNTRANLI